MNSPKLLLEIEHNNYGTQHYYRTNNKKLVFTDGMKEVADKMHCYWLIDKVVANIDEVDKFVTINYDNCKVLDSETMNVVLEVKDGKANFSICAFGYDEDTEDEVITKIVNEDIEVLSQWADGKYIFFLGPNQDFYVLYLSSEY